MIATKESVSDAQSSGRTSDPARDRLFALAVGIGVFLVLLVTRNHVLTQLPTWDGAMGMTPAALTLVDTNFDLLDLLRQPSYLDGGPNTHSLSLATLTTAGVIALVGSYQSAVPILHLMSFALAGLLTAGVYLLVVRATTDRPLAVTAAAVTILYPPVLVQASDVYLDLPMTAAVVWALYFAFAGRRGLTILLSCIAIWIKPTAVIALPALAYLLASHPDSQPGRWSAFAAMAPPTALALGVFMVTGSYAGEAQTNSALTRLRQIAFDSVWYSTRSPAFLVLVGAAVIALAVGSRVVRHEQWQLSARLRLVQGMSIFFASALLFFLLNPLVTSGFSILPRYTIILAPPLAALIAVSVSLLSRRVAISSCLALGIAMAVFISGWLAPSAPSYYSLSERDLSYENHLVVQRQAIAKLEELSHSMPIYYDHFSHFRFEYPETGWTSGPPADGTPVYLLAEGSIRLETMPGRFALLVETHWLGGLALQDVWSAAIESTEYETEVYEYTSDRFANYVVVVTRKSISNG